MICSQCGSEIVEGAIFCPVCDTEIDSFYITVTDEKTRYTFVLGFFALVVELLGLVALNIKRYELLGEAFIFVGLIIGLYNMYQVYQSVKKETESFFSFINSGLNGDNRSEPICCAAVFLGIVILLSNLIVQIMEGLMGTIIE